MNMFTLARNFDNLDHKAIAQWVAENAPETFLSAANRIGEHAWVTDLPVLYHTKDGYNVVAAIKHIRTNTGLGLKEAKYVFDCLVHKTSRDCLTPEEVKVYDQIVANGVTYL